MESQYTSPGATAISEAVVDQLRRTKGWVLFFAVLLWIGGALLILGGIVLISISALGGAMGELAAPGFGIAMGSGVALAYWVMAILYIFPALKLTKFSSRITELVNHPVEAHLIAALDQQRAFWKFVGIAMIVMIVLYIGIIIFSVAAAGLGAAATGI